MSGIICDERKPSKLNFKVHKTVVHPALMYGIKTVGLTKRQDLKLKVAEMKVLRFSAGVTQLDKI